MSSLSVEEDGECILDQVITTSRDMYTLKKRIAYLMAFAGFVVAKVKKVNFQKQDLNATFLDHALVKTKKYVRGIAASGPQSTRCVRGRLMISLLFRDVLMKSVANRRVQDGVKR